MPAEVFECIDKMRKLTGNHCWACDSCQSAMSKVNTRIVEIEQRMTTVEQSVTINSTTIDKIDSKVDKTAADVEKLKDDMKKVNESSTSSSSESVFEEIRNRKAKENNIIVHGLPEPARDIKKVEDRINADKDSLSDVMKTIKVKFNSTKDVKFMHRIGEANKDKDDSRADQTKPRPLLVGFRAIDKKTEVLNNARHLKNSKHEKLSIIPDLTKQQRQEDADLRHKANELNTAMDDAESENYEHVVIGQRGQRVLVRRRKRQPPTKRSRRRSPSPDSHTNKRANTNASDSDLEMEA